MKRKGLPFKAALKIGAGCIKRSPVRFIVALFLFAVSLTMLGVCLALGFTDQETLEQSAIGAEEFTIVFSERGWDKNELADLNESTGMKFQPLLAETGYHAYYFFPEQWSEGTVYPRDGVCCTEEIIQAKDYALTGRLPQSGDEIALTLCVAKSFLFQYGGIYYDQLTYPVVETETRYIRDERGYCTVNTLNELVSGDFYLSVGSRDEEAKRVKIVGVVDTHCPHSHIYYSDYDETSAPHDKLIFAKGVAHGRVNFAVALPASVSSAKMLLSLEKREALQIASGGLNVIRSNADTIQTTENVFMGLGIAFSVFSALLIYQFVGLSLEKKRQEIGIMRALGARKGSVLLIFMLESVLLAVISAALALGATPLVMMAVSDYLFDTLGIAFNTHFAVYPIVAALALGVATIASLFPVLRAASRSPVDTIRKNNL